MNASGSWQLYDYELKKLSTSSLLSYIEYAKRQHDWHAVGEGRAELSRRKKELRNTLKDRRNKAKRRKGAKRRQPFRVTTRVRDSLEVRELRLDQGGYANKGRDYYGYVPGTKIYEVTDNDRDTFKVVRASSAKEARDIYLGKVKTGLRRFV